ncbi:hypothetical protein [Henriciella sp.]|uniref:hypothetical protein n=1 Tax=Henriciella sp. TaxID=1968823 RepID=UPI0026217400|nr:hypothetical protein [Henriciella sp.]
MSKSHLALEKLVALRQQKAEQALAMIKAEIRESEEAISALEAQLGELDASAGDYESFSLSIRFGAPGRISEQIEAARKALKLKQDRLAAAQLELKKAIHSRRQLKTESAGGPSS